MAITIKKEDEIKKEHGFYTKITEDAEGTERK